MNDQINLDQAVAVPQQLDLDIPSDLKRTIVKVDGEKVFVQTEDQVGNEVAASE